MKAIFKVRPEGLYCPSGDFFIDAWKPVPLCLVTHAHGDHAYPGHARYIAPDQSLKILKFRLGDECPVQSFPYTQKFKIKDCWLSFHPSGHILGSAQIRIEVGETVLVVSGDYKRAYDPTCEPFEVVECDHFITESTFALPIYHWDAGELIAQKIYEWWLENRSQGLNSILYCYSLGKAQRILALLNNFTRETIYLHGAILPRAKIYSDQGIALASFSSIDDQKSKLGNLILAPPMAKGSSWNKRFYPYKTAFASGWMQVRGVQKRRNVDKGFVLSDHADWSELLMTINQTKAKKVFTTHGEGAILARYLQENNIDARVLQGLEEYDEDDD